MVTRHNNDKGDSLNNCEGSQRVIKQLKTMSLICGPLTCLLFLSTDKTKRFDLKWTVHFYQSFFSNAIIKG